MHSHYWLLNRTDILSKIHPLHEHEADTQNLNQLNRALLNFRRYYHHLFPSHLTTHNSFHTLWQSVFEVERLLSFLSETVKEVSEESRKAANEKHDRQLAFLSYASGGLAGMGGTQHLLGVWRDKQLDNNYVWQSRLHVERCDLIREIGGSPATEQTTQRLQKIDAEIAATTELANAWEGYMFWGSWAGLAVGVAVAWLFRRHH